MKYRFRRIGVVRVFYELSQCNVRSPHEPLAEFSQKGGVHIEVELLWHSSRSLLELAKAVGTA